MSRVESSEFENLASLAMQGDVAASQHFTKLFAEVAHKWLRVYGIGQLQDREDIVQTVLVRFLTTWDSSRSSAYTFAIRLLLPTARAMYFRAQDSAKKHVARNATETKIESLETSEQNDLSAELLATVLRTRTSFLNAKEKEVIRCRIAHPDWTAQEVAETCRSSGAVVSLAMYHKLPLEFMNRWATSTNFQSSSELLVGFEKRLERWHRQGDTSLTATGLDLLLAGFVGKRRPQTLWLLDIEGNPIVFNLLILRTQIALARQELEYADRLLNWFELLLRRPPYQNAYAWHHKLHYVRGRWHTADFRYGDALITYSKAFEVPQAIWKKDPVFLHSVAVAYRGVRNFDLAEDFINRSLAVYAEQGRIVDVAHTLSRKARIEMEKGEVERSTKALTAADNDLARLREQYPNFPQLSPLGYVQNRLHWLRFSALTQRDPFEIRDDIEDTQNLINRGAYAHEFLELKEVCEQYDLAGRIKGLKIAYTPTRPRFGQKRLARLRQQIR